MNNNVHTIDDLIRARAVETLTEEIAKAFKPLEKYFGSGTDSNRLIVPANGASGIEIGTDPRDRTREVYVVSVWEVFKALRQKALENSRNDRGNQAVSDFMERVEALGAEIDEIRQGQQEG